MLSKHAESSADGQSISGTIEEAAQLLLFTVCV